MGLETPFNYIDDLEVANPAAGDDPSEGDDHIRGIKSAVKGSFTSLGQAAVTKTAAEINDLASLTGTETLTNKTLTSPVINDTNGNELLEFSTTASALNHLKIANRGTGAAPYLAAVAGAGESEVGILLLDSNLNECVNLESVAIAVNYLRVINAATGGTVQVIAGGSDPAIPLTVRSEGAGQLTLQSPTGDVSIVSGGDTIIDAAVTDSVTAETTDGNLALAGNGTGEVLIHSQRAYGMVVLDAHELLVSGSAAVGSWTQFNMSGGGTQAAAAATAGANKAIIKIFVQSTEGSAGGSGNGTVYIQKNSLGGAIGIANIAAQSIAVMDAGSSTSAISKQYATITVNLDGNSDFEYQIASTGTAISWSMTLVGYYV